MPEYTWQPFLSLGVEELDAQHKRLIAIANDFLDAARSGQADRAVRHAAAALLAHADEHFADEEAYMASIGYPDLDAHREKHRDLHTRAADLVQRLEASETVEPRTVDVLIKTWLLEHILGTDLEIAAFTASPGN